MLWSSSSSVHSKQSKATAARVAAGLFLLSLSVVVVAGTGTGGGSRGGICGSTPAFVTHNNDVARGGRRCERGRGENRRGRRQRPCDRTKPRDSWDDSVFDAVDRDDDDDNDTDDRNNRRRQILTGALNNAALGVAAGWSSTFGVPPLAFAEDVPSLAFAEDGGTATRTTTTTATSTATGGAPPPPTTPVLATAKESVSTKIPANVVEMREFVDPMGLFELRVPKRFYALRRSAKGDLPDSQTGKGRRGSSIFTAGDMGKAEIIAVERFPTRLLLEENGIDASGDLTTFPKLGDPNAVAQLLTLRRERDTSNTASGANTIILPDSVTLSSDQKVLTFKLRTRIDAQRPELLMEQYGVSELIRVTVAKASLRSGDDKIMAVYASALESDFNGPDGKALYEAVDSFRVTAESKPAA